MHTDIPTRSELVSLLEARDPACVSIFLPTSVVTQDTRGERIELKTRASEAIDQLASAGVDRDAVGHVREALEGLVEDDDFWAEQARSLAVFVDSERVRTFRLPNRLSATLEVGDRFYVKPLLRAVTFPQAAFVLALAAGSVRLIEISREGPPSTIKVPELPADAAGAAGKASIADRAPSRRIQGSEGQKVRLRQFARKVDQALRGVLSGLDLPLILAATQPLDGIYRSVSSYPHLVDEGIAGSPEGAADGELAEAARGILDRLYGRELAEMRDRFELRLDQGRASTDVAAIARAATYGAVDTVFVDIDERLAGRIDDQTGAVTLTEDDAASYGVIDEIARRVLLSGGRVLAVRRSDVPGDGPVAAIMRYAI
jgi:Bacterial archaeo-eukaryotic release factor family 11